MNDGGDILKRSALLYFGGYLGEDNVFVLKAAEHIGLLVKQHGGVGFFAAAAAAGFVKHGFGDCHFMSLRASARKYA